MSIIKETGSLMLGSRFLRLSKTFLNEINEIYKALEIGFEPTWFPLFFLLDKEGEVLVSTIAEELEITQSAASQMVSSLEKKNLLLCTRSEQDKRAKNVSFTSEGQKLQEKIKPIWISMERNMNSILHKGEKTGSLLAVLEEVETLMSTLSLKEMVLDDIEKNAERSEK